MLDVVAFVADCLAVVHGDDTPLPAVRDVLARALADSASVTAALGRDEAGIDALHVSPELTVLNVVWGPGMRLFPHDHRMWAAIGMYGGTEDNEFFRREAGTIVPSGGRTAHERDVLLLGDDAIHAVTNPLDGLTGAIHVYGGDFFTTPRSEWDPATLEEAPYDFEHTRRLFDESNARTP